MHNRLFRISDKAGLIFIYGLMVSVVFVLPYFSAEGYSILTHTTSQLGAQNTHNSWIMNFVFFLLALVTAYKGSIIFKKDLLLLFLVLLFSFSLVMAAIFSHAPISPAVIYSQSEDSLHSLFSTITGFAFTFFAISYAFSQKAKKRMTAISVAILATVFSILIFKFPELAGIWQRVIFFTTFFWLFFSCYN